jgi:hypothetical protein
MAMVETRNLSGEVDGDRLSEAKQVLCAPRMARIERLFELLGRDERRAAYRELERIAIELHGALPDAETSDLTARFEAILARWEGEVEHRLSPALSAPAREALDAHLAR